MGRLVQGLSHLITHSQSSVVYLQTLLTMYSGGGGLDDLGGYSPAGDTFSAALMEVSCVLVLCSY